MSFDALAVKNTARGRWREILTSMAKVPDSYLVNRHGPCPNCTSPEHRAESDRFRFDDRNGDGTWYCNQCGGKEGRGGGGDGFLLIMRMTGWGFSDTVNAVGNWLNGIDPEHDMPRWKSPVYKEPERPIDTWTPIIPVPSEADTIRVGIAHKIWNPKYVSSNGEIGRWSEITPSHVAKIIDTKKVMHGVVVRFELVENDKRKKFPIQCCFCANRETGETRWVMCGIPAPKPLYGIDSLNDCTHALVVLGERKRDLLQEKLEFPVVSIVGGDGAVKANDWSPLVGKMVCVWPDNDKSAWTAAQRICDILGHENTCVLRPIKGTEPKWDCGNAIESGWTDDQILEYISTTKEDPGFPFELSDYPIAEEVLPDWVTDDFSVPQKVEVLEIEPDKEKRKAKDEKFVSRAEEIRLSVNHGDPIEYVSKHARMELEQWPDVLEGKKKLVKLNTTLNFKTLMDFYGVSFKYDILKKSIEISIPELSTTVDNSANVQLAFLKNICHTNNFSTSEVDLYTKSLADINAVNPVANWIDSFVWDGRDRIRQLLDTIETPSPQMRDLLVTKWLVQAVAALYQPPPFSAHGVLVFHGKQGKGKTSWVKRLLPKHLSFGYIAEGISLDPTLKDSVIGAIRNWICELGELESTMRRDLARLKAYIPKYYDELRLPYDRVPSTYLRKTVFFASVNQDHFLRDETGDRRWWVIDTTKINYEHNIDLGQLWSQVKNLYLSGFRYWLNEDETVTLNTSNIEWREVNENDDLLEDRYNWDAPKELWVNKTATDVIIDLGLKLDHKVVTGMGMAMARNINIPKIRTKGGRRLWSMPPLIVKNAYNPHSSNDGLAWFNS